MHGRDRGLEIHLHDKPDVWSLGDDATTSYGIGTGAVGLVIGVMAGIILRSPGHRVIGCAMGGVGLFWSLDGVSESWVRLALATEDAVPGMTWRCGSCSASPRCSRRASCCCR